MNDRQRGILLHLVAAEDPLTSDYLAQQLDVSSRTIKSDMVVLSAELRENGAELISRQNRGYSLQILDDERFQTLYAFTSMKMGRTSSQGEGARMLYIARKLVAAPTGVLLDELAEELYLSRGALRAPLREAVTFCESFHLQVTSIPGQGLRVTGEEHLLRLAATELFEMHFHTMELEQADENYAKWVECDSKERQDIRHTFLAVLRESPFALLDMSTQRIARYLVLARNRCRAGMGIHLPHAWVREVHTSPLYEVADRIYTALAQQFDDFRMDDEEVCFLAILLMIGLSPSYHPASPEPIPYLTRRTAELTGTLLECAYRRTGIDLAALPGVRALLQETLLPIVVQARYGLDGYQSLSGQTEGHYLQLPVEVYYARLLAAELSRQLPCKISNRDLSILSCYMNIVLWQVEYPIKPLRLIMSNSDIGGNAYSQLVSRRLKEQWPKLIDSIDAMSLYEVRRMDPDSYDAVLLGYSRHRNISSYYNYNAPAAFVMLNQPHQSFDSVYNNVLIHAFQFSAVLPKAETFHLHEGFRYYDVEQAFQFLCARYARDPACEVRMLSLLRQQERILSLAQRDCAIVLVERELCKEDCFHFYRLSKPGLWGDQRIQWLLFLTVPRQDPAALKALGILLGELSKNGEKICEFVEAPQAASLRLLQENMQTAQKSSI